MTTKQPDSSPTPVDAAVAPAPSEKHPGGETLFLTERAREHFESLVQRHEGLAFLAFACGENNERDKIPANFRQEWVSEGLIEETEKGLLVTPLGEEVARRLKEVHTERTRKTMAWLLGLTDEATWQDLSGAIMGLVAGRIASKMVAETGKKAGEQ